MPPRSKPVVSLGNLCNWGRKKRKLLTDLLSHLHKSLHSSQLPGAVDGITCCNGYAGRILGETWACPSNSWLRPMGVKGLGFCHSYGERNRVSAFWLRSSASGERTVVPHTDSEAEPCPGHLCMDITTVGQVGRQRGMLISGQGFQTQRRIWRWKQDLRALSGHLQAEQALSFWGLWSCSCSWTLC